MTERSESRVILETERLRMREFRAADAPRIYEFFADPEARRVYTWMSDPSEGDEWVRRNRERYLRDGFGLWALELRSNGELIGDCGMTWKEIDGRDELEVGYHLHADFRGHGYATEAASACLDHAFQTVPTAARVCSIVKRDNEPSHRVARRLHDEQFDTVMHHGEDAHDCVVYFTRRETWRDREGG